MINNIAGIDLGTTNSVITIINKDGLPETVLNQYNRTITPSVIYFNPDPVIGEEAKEMQAIGEENIAAFFKRNMGDPNFLLHFYGNDYNPVDLSALILKQLKTDAEFFLGEMVSDVVITVPAYFNDIQRKSTIEAGKQAGLNVLRIINEPTAAALGYGINNTDKPKFNLVFDLGGGTFDISIVKLSNNNIQVIATDGDHSLGGKDWDNRIAIYLCQQFEEHFGNNPLQDSGYFNDILVRVESAKKVLSKRTKVSIPITFNGKKSNYEITRKKFEEITSDLLERTVFLTEQALQSIGLEWQDISGILLVGGSTRMPMIHQFSENKLGVPPLTGVNVDEVVSRGAAIQAAKDICYKKDIFFLAPLVQDVMSHSMGIVAINENRTKYVNSIIIPKNRKIPCVENRPFQLRTHPHKENKLEVYMTQGESDLPLECTILGKYSFLNVPHAKDGMAILNISYAYDKNGVVQVSASIKSTSENLPITIEPIPDDMSWLALPPEEEEIFTHVTIYLCIDTSISMNGSPIKEAKEAALKFIEKCDLTHMSIGITSFSSQAQINLNACQNAKKIERAIYQLNASGSTNMTDALTLTHQQLKTAEGPRFIVLLSDGSPNTPLTAKKAAKDCHNDKIDIITIGTGSANTDFLNKLASCEAANIFSASGSLVSTFSKIAQVLTETGGGIQLSESQKEKGIFELLNK